MGQDNKKDDEFIKDFIDEAREHTNNAERSIINYEQTRDPKLINEIFRAYHSLKGLAGFVNMDLIQELAHDTENLLEVIRKHKKFEIKEYDLIILSSNDFIKKIIEDLTLLEKDLFVAEIRDHMNKISEICKTYKSNVVTQKIEVEIKNKPEIKDTITEEINITKDINPERTNDKKEVVIVSREEGKKHSSEDSKLVKYLTFNLSKEDYGISIDSVREIIGMLKITEVPKTPVYIKGVVNLRGKIIPVMDLRLRFGLDERAYNERTCIVVIEIRTEKGTRNIGIIVDTVSEVLNINSDDIEEVQNEDIKNEGDFITGMANVKDRVVMLLDTEKIISSEALTRINTIKEGD